MKTNKLLLAISAALFSSSLLADVVGFSAGVYPWRTTIDGTVQSGGDPISLDQDLKLGQDYGAIAYIGLEHPIPIVPNVKLRYTKLSDSNYGDINTSFNGQNFQGRTRAEVDISHTDLILYYEILDNFVELDAGLAAKYFDGKFVLESTTSSPTFGSKSETSVKQLVPALYGMGAVSLPANFAVGLDAMAMKYSKSQMTDVTARVSWEITILGLEAGYRHLKADLEDVKGIDSDTTVHGPYVALYVHF